MYTNDILNWLSKSAANDPEEKDYAQIYYQISIIHKNLHALAIARRNLAVLPGIIEDDLKSLKISLQK